MANTTNLGRVLLIPKGAWNEEAEYSKLDFVTSAGSSYVAKSAVPEGTPVSNTTYWQLLASKGETGGLAQIASEFSESNSYSIGDYCVYEGDLYRFTEEHESGAWSGEDVIMASVSDEMARIADANDLALKADVSDLALKQDALTFDNSPTSGSDNPVKSGGVYTALSGKQNTLTFDSSPTSSSNNPVKSGGVYTALSGKANSTHTHSTSDITSGTLGTARGGTGNANGTIAKLTTPRSLYVNLGTSYDSSSPVTFDGSANKALPVNGTLGVAHGGTGGTDSGWQSLTNSSVFTGTIYYRKIGKFCHLYAQQCTLQTELTSVNGVVLGAINTGYRPASDLSFNAPSTNGHFTFRVNSNGNVSFFKERGVSMPVTDTFYLNAFYMLA